eukprot:gb/GECG01004078.1/.p1 GENE.gb/GECG01004078.1/~~gb/GECG01004078.1/.p1  ORF type:complete len:617 (+),score=64.18 gb/GECG01004078.1/:1-1851(+)
MVTAASSATIAKELVNITNKQIQGDSEVCPICCEAWDEQDRRFFPCQCGYQVCMFCWKRIREEGNSRCPACREIYSENPQFKDPSEMEAMNADGSSGLNGSGSEDMSSLNGDSTAAGERTSGVNQGDPQRKSNTGASVARTIPPADRARLRGVRVLQKNLVYVVGLPMSIARESLLRRPEYFGQYGKIKKIVVNRKIGESTGRPDSACAYITFTCREDAECAIRALDGFTYNGRVIKAMYGTTKYCHQFLQGRPCHNPECLYLHHVDEVAPSFTKEEMQAGKNFQQIAHPGIPEGAKVIEKNGKPRAVFPAPIKVVDYGNGSSEGQYGELDDRQATNAILQQRSENFRQQQANSRFQQIPSRDDAVLSSSPDSGSEADGEVVVAPGELLSKRSRLTALALSGNYTEDFSPLTAPLGNISFSLPSTLTTPVGTSVDSGDPIQWGSRILIDSLNYQLQGLQRNMGNQSKEASRKAPVADLASANSSKERSVPASQIGVPNSFAGNADSRKFGLGAETFTPAAIGVTDPSAANHSAWTATGTGDISKLPQALNSVDLNGGVQGMNIINGAAEGQQQPTGWNSFGMPPYQTGYGMYQQQPGAPGHNPNYNSGVPGAFNRM